MDTAKVDIRKLQILNDRINQTIDALNQVRLSVHGLQHTGPVPFAPQYAQYAQFAQPQPIPPYAQPFPQHAQPYPQYAQPYPYGPQQAAILAQMAGLSHSNPYAQPNPYQQQAYAQQAYAQQALAQQAYAQQALAQQALAQQLHAQQNQMAMNPLAQNPWAQQAIGLGIGHSAPIDAAWEAQRLAQDPWYPVRVAQSFPFANQPIPPSNGIG